MKFLNQLTEKELLAIIAILFLAPLVTYLAVYLLLEMGFTLK